MVKPLNYFPYIKKDAIKLLSEMYGWKEYPQKHFESRFTKFYEGYWLPLKFGYDTRKVQFSSLILTGQMTRDEALERLKVPAYDQETITDEFKYIATKLKSQKRNYVPIWMHPTKATKITKIMEGIFVLGAKILKAIGAENSIKR